MDFREIRSKFLTYFETHGHQIVESSSLIPQDDPTLLFTNAGMVQFKRLFLGEEKRGYQRATTSQKCVRAGGKHNDLENVGYTARHHTFFEMLGNFSFGDYFKEETILWAWELLTEGYGLPSERLYATVYTDDDEAYGIWEKEIGIPGERIVRLGEKDNFWAMGDTGPCGPCSEILIDQGPAMSCGRPDCAPGCECDRYLEIWNLVFTQFDRQPDGALNPLPRPNIDTGMGLERLAAVVQGVTSNYDTDLFRHIISGIENIAGCAYGEDDRRNVAFRVIADHARAAAFLIGDGIMPANEGRGYVLRRIIRRAIRFGQVLGIESAFLNTVCNNVILSMGEDYNELLRSKAFIEEVLKSEERRFADTLHYGMRVLNEEIEALRVRNEHTIPGEVAFKLYDTFGLSLDIVEDVARDENLQVDRDGYENAMSRQRTMSQESWAGSGEEEIPEAVRDLLAQGLASRFIGYDTLSASAGVTALVVDGKRTETIEAGAEVDVILDQTPFYGEAGGQVGDRGLILGEHMRFQVTDTLKFSQNAIVHRGKLEEGRLSEGDRVEARVDRETRKNTALNHTATHLLHAALQEVLGDHVKQSGSRVAPDRFRFDFSHFAQLSPDQIAEVERLVNGHIRNNFPLQTNLMSKDDAMKTGAMAIFEERYGDTVRLVEIGDHVSMELCGGTHTERTGDIGLFRIVSEGAVAANVRRIEALTGDAALTYVQAQEQALRTAASLLKAAPEQINERLERLLQEHRQRDRELEALKGKLRSQKSDDFLKDAMEIGGIRAVAREIEADSPKELRESADQLKDKLKSGIVLLGAKNEGKAMLVCVVTADLMDRFKAGDIIRELSKIIGGKGGGRPDMAQGGGGKPEALGDALAALSELISVRK
ncbi:MAG: alanine--tRNA ligase [Deltaproteobacteria bacterium]|nr:alanine--tRNA ligase [Deltaproteobacteria bacterium]